MQSIFYKHDEFRGGGQLAVNSHGMAEIFRGRHGYQVRDGRKVCNERVSERQTSLERRKEKERQKYVDKIVVNTAR